MQRDPLIQLLELYSPLDSEEILYKKRMLSFIKQNPKCFERTLDIGHITSSSWLVDSTKTKALLLHHAKLNIWCQPGGHCDGNSNVLLTAIKEAKEESGIEEITAVKPTIFDIDIHLIPAKGNTPEHFHYDIRFLLQITKNVAPIINQESKAFLWITKDLSSVPTKERSILRMWEKYFYPSK